MTLDGCKKYEDGTFLTYLFKKISSYSAILEVRDSTPALIGLPGDYAECKTYYFGTGTVVTVLWLVAATTLWFLRKRRRAGGTKQNSNITHEMTPVTETKEGGNLIYSSIVFNDDEKTPRMKNSEKEITYAEIKNTAKQDDGLVYADVKFNERRKERENPQRNSGAEATYADVKLSGQSQAENANTDLYASVVKNPKVNVQQNT